MANKKVYLAKNVLASGFDVEYVKSHLERIPGIIIIESGMGIKPEECAAFVIVPNAKEKYSSGEDVYLSKNVWLDLDSFLDNYEGEEECPEDCVYIFKEALGTTDHSDVEKTSPKAFYCTDLSYLEQGETDDYDKYGVITVELLDEDTEDGQRDDCPLLYCINGHIHNPGGSWLRNSRHHQPEAQFAVPPVPTVEQRMLKQSALSVDDSEHKLKVNHTVMSEDRRMLLLLRRK